MLSYQSYVPVTSVHLQLLLRAQDSSLQECSSVRLGIQDGYDRKSTVSLQSLRARPQDGGD